MAEILRQTLPKLNKYTVISSTTSAGYLARVRHVLAVDPQTARGLVAELRDTPYVVLEGHCKIVWPAPTQIDEVNKP